MLKILPFIILVFLVPPLFAYFHYVMIKKIYEKPNIAKGLLYLRVVIGLFITIGGPLLPLDNPIYGFGLNTMSRSNIYFSYYIGTNAAKITVIRKGL